MTTLLRMIAFATVFVLTTGTAHATRTPHHAQHIMYGQEYQIRSYKVIKHRKSVHRKSSKKRHLDANGNRTRRMVTVQTVQGFNITVHPAYAGKFLKFFSLLKERGYEPPPDITGCYSTQHKRGSNHAIGAACDIQYGWNGCDYYRGHRRCAPEFIHHMGDIIKQAGLYDGCSFGDCGHIEAVRGLYNRAPDLYASLAKFKVEQSTASYQP